MKYLYLISLIIFCCNVVFAQPYIEGGKTKHRFAQLNLGFDTRTFLSNGSEYTFINSFGLIEKAELKNQTETRLIIGGTHFWGHADFYIAFPAASFGGSGFKSRFETGTKIFPWRIEQRKLRPYFGAAWLTTRYEQGEGVQQIRNKFPLITGFVYNIKNHLIEIGAGYNYNNSNSYYINTTYKTQIKTQPFWISLGYKIMIETTLSAEKDWKSGKTKAMTDTLAKLRKLNGLTIAIGPSTAIFLKEATHNANVAPFIDNHKIANVFPEIGIGYYLHKPDLQFNLAYRNISSRNEAYGYLQEVNRKALTFEVYKFFADYNGFAVFAGPAISQEWLKVKENNLMGETELSTFNGIKPGVTFGWDIRPNRLQSWYLRTNLRWFPNLDVKMRSGKNVPIDQLEFNFIQLVVFPDRLFKKMAGENKG